PGLDAHALHFQRLLQQRRRVPRDIRLWSRLIFLLPHKNPRQQTHHQQRRNAETERQPPIYRRHHLQAQRLRHGWDKKAQQRNARTEEDRPDQVFVAHDRATQELLTRLLHVQGMQQLGQDERVEKYVVRRHHIRIALP